MNKEKIKQQLISIALGAIGSMLSAVIVALTGPGVDVSITPVDGVVGASVAWLQAAYA